MNVIHALILGIVQGLTEFFPVSSSGHLIVFPLVFHWPDQGQAFDTVLHLGTLAALVWFFWKELIVLVKESLQNDEIGARARSFCLRVFVAAVPALMVGYFFSEAIERLTRSAGLVAFGLAFWAIVLFAADHRSSRLQKKSPSQTQNTQIPDTQPPPLIRDRELVAPYSLRDVSWKQAIAIGLSQPIALLPGTSRSGITMTAGLFVGLSREAAARFSFFVSIPVIAAAGGYGLMKTIKHGIYGDGMLSLVVGFFTAAFVGAYAIRFLLSYVSKHRFDAFVCYRVALAVALFFLL